MGDRASLSLVDSRYQAWEGVKMAETDSPAVANNERMASLMRAATYASVSVATLLIVIKFGAWVVSDSVSLLSSLVDSLLDVAASLVNLFAIRHALQPADAEHRFGHGKAESLAGLAQAAFIAGSGMFLVLEAGERFFNPQIVERGEVAIAVMVVSVVLTVGLVAFQTYVVRRTNSLAISADSLHYRVDIMVNLAVILALVLATQLGWVFADPLFALVIVAYMAWGAIKIGRRSVEELMDREFDDDDRTKIRDIVLGHPGVLSVHDMRTRSAGPDSFIQLHVEMGREITLLEAHEIADDVMYRVEAAFPNAEVLVHQDPEGVEERRDAI